MTVEYYFKETLILGVALAAAAAITVFFLHSILFSTHTFTNTVEYNGTQYIITQSWHQPDNCIFGINYTNGTVLWGQGWMPLRPSLMFWGNKTKDIYRWNLQPTAQAIYQQEQLNANGIWWGCCMNTCV